MDPITDSLNRFHDQVRAFRLNEEKKILCIVTPSEHSGMLSKVIRAEEWQSDNRSPFLICNQAYHKDSNDVAEQISRYIREHYALIRNDFEKEDITLPPLRAHSTNPDRPFDIVAEHIAAFNGCLKEHLAPSFFCWLPTMVKSFRHWQEELVWFIDFLLEEQSRIIISADKEKHFSRIVDDHEQDIEVICFNYNQQEANGYFQKLFGPPARGHQQGTPSGAAAPDVQPPPRKAPPVPMNDTTRAAIDALNPPPSMTPKQGEILRANVISAAWAVGRKDKDGAIAMQTAACKVCEEAGVILEHALMRLTLANYYLQFKDLDNAFAHYQKAEALAQEVTAYNQIAQIRMAMAFVYMRKRKTLEQAIYHYEQAAAAAAIGESPMLYLEALRMAGTVYLKRKQQDAALLCWQAAVTKACGMSKEEVRNSGFLDIAAKLISLYEKNDMVQQAHHMKMVVEEIGEQFDR